MALYGIYIIIWVHAILYYDVAVFKIKIYDCLNMAATARRNMGLDV